MGVRLAHSVGQHGVRRNRRTGPVPSGADATTERRTPHVPTAPNPQRRPKVLLMLGDAGAVFAGLALAFAVQFAVRPVPSYLVVDQLGVAAAGLPAFAIGAGFNHLYRARANERPIEEAGNIVKSVAVMMGTTILVALAIQYKDLSRLWVVLVAAAVTFMLLIERRIARAVFRRVRLSGRLRRRIIVVGTDPHAIGLLHRYSRNPALGYDVVGFVGDDDLGSRENVEVLGPVHRLPELLELHGATGVVVSLASVASGEVNRLTRRLTDHGYHVALSAGLRDIDLTRLRPQAVDGQTLIYVEPVIRTGWRAVTKRLFDITLASAVLLVTFPVLLIAAVLIKFDSAGPLLFRQVRVGKDGELFEVIKLRTMTTDAEQRKAELLDQNEADGPLFKMTHDPRITRVGRILRKLSIDELPQLLCVISGTMSMVGPRPALPSEVEQWDDDVLERLAVLPGLTGMWQVSGRSNSSFEQYKRLDLYYVDNWSLLHDLKICTRTVGVVLSGRGAS